MAEASNIPDRLWGIIVLGNGFDLDIGLKTRYSDFAKSEQWKKLYEENVEKSKHYSLLKFLNDKREVDCWFDIEKALLDYASIGTKNVWIHDLETDRREYGLLCDALAEYLKSILETPKDIDRNSIGIQLLWDFFRLDFPGKILYTFNYTPIDRIIGYCNIAPLDVPETYPIHGEYEYNTHILGIEVNSLDEIIPEYSFLIKSNSNNYHSVNIEADMMNAEEVIIFGHSLNLIDAVYFDDYLRFMSSNGDEKKRVTFITYDNDSKLQILDNIRRMGISVPKLYSRGHLEFILTANIRKGQGNDSSLFEELKNRI